MSAPCFLTQQEGEARVKGEQRRFLCWVEEHPALSGLEQSSYNAIRKRLYRATFRVFRLGIMGCEHPDPELYEAFCGWMQHPELALIEEEAEEIRARCFATALEIFRIGARVEGARP